MKLTVVIIGGYHCYQLPENALGKTNIRSVKVKNLIDKTEKFAM
jgi:hypothetical protein